MAQVPYSGAPSVAPQLNPTPEINVDAPAGAFGAGSAQATAGFGRTLEHVGDELFARANAMQQLDQQAEAANAVAELSDNIGKLDLDYRMLEGRAAKDAYQPFADSVNKVREDIGAKLGSDYARKLYLNESRAIQSRAVIGAGAHAGHEFRKYLVGTEEAGVKAASQAAASDPTSDSAYEAALAKVDSSGKMMQTLHGWSDAQRDDYVGTKKSEAVFGRATALARTDPGAAQKVLDSAVKSGLISSDVAGRAGTYIRNQRNSVTSRVESARFLAGEGSHFGEVKVSSGRLREAISSVESNGNYNPPHPAVTHTVNGQKITERALGRYGIMQSNLQPWLKEAGMPAMSETEFLNDHKAQDQLAEFKLAQFQDKYGSANKAAMVWFTGRPNPDPSSNDGHTSAPGYLKKFNAGLARTANATELIDLSQKRAKEIIPDDDEFHQVFRDKVLTEHSREIQIQKQAEFDNRQIIESAIVPDKDGRLITSIEEIDDPKVHEAWDALQPAQRNRYLRLFAANAKGDYAPTEANQREYQTWLGRLVDPTASEDDRAKALNADYATMPMPANQRDQLIKLRAKMFSKTARNPAMGHAMQVLGPMLNDAGITRKLAEEDYYQFQGTLHNVLEQRMEETGKPLKDEEIKTIGAGLLRNVVYGRKWFGLMSDEGPAYKAEVPEAVSKNIIDRYKAAKGFEPTEQQIQQLWAAMQYNEFYTKVRTQGKEAAK